MAFPSVLQWLRSRQQYRQDRAYLEGLDTVLLSDLGITREQIPAYLAGDLPNRTRHVRPHLRLVEDTAAAPAPAKCCEAAA